ncbi:amino acid adenylation domain-containing protein [Kordia sp. TARA_039_SRF]|nr:amino acid adenylation domain-containing protein [Kordia sp. TARA_039_SRF]
MNTVKRKIISNYWTDKLKGKTSVNFGNLTSIRSEIITIPNSELTYFSKVTSGNQLAEFTVLLAIFNTLTQRYLEECFLIFSEGIPGNDNVPLLYSFEEIDKKNLKEILQNVKAEVKEVYKHSTYDNSLNIKESFNTFTPYGFFYNKEITEVPELPFSIYIKTKQDVMEIQVSYSEKFVSKDVAEHFLKNIGRWLQELEVVLTTPCDKISLIFEEEKDVLLHDFNATTKAYDSSDTIVSLFEKQVAKTPDAISIICQNKSFTYQEIHEKSNQLAHYLKDDCGVVSEDLVAVKLPRTENLIIALLAVLKTGAAYVPVDVNYPQERINFIEKDSNSKVVINETVLNAFENKKDSFPTTEVEAKASPSSLGYIIYTSGTTGNPKGVMITHANAAAMIHWAQSEFDASKFEIVFAGTSHCFDLSVYEMFYTFSIGKKLNVLSSGLEIRDALAKHKNILLNTVPSTVRKLLEDGVDLNNITVLNLAGEAFPVDIANKLQKTHIEVRNLYGPSEDTTYSTYYKISDKPYKTSIPIGKPLDNTQAYILDEYLSLVPIGVAGKLYLSGTGLSKGYLNRKELTKEKFIPNPFEEGQLMYDTGDLATWMLDGNIAFLGRKDHQVKLRGYRIELGEIQAAIQGFSEAIQQVVVVVKQNAGEDVLVAFFVTESSIDITSLRTFLLDKLPSYMVPGFFIEMEQLPLTPNGKVDRKALPELSEKVIKKENYVAPRTHEENYLVAIWEEILGVEKIGVKDHFFELGGHSLMISQLINRVHKTMGKQIPFKIFYTNPTVESLSNAMKNEAFVAIQKTSDKSFYPVTPSQHRLWLLSQMEGGSSAYLITTSLLLEGSLAIDNFSSAFDYVMHRHEVLRTYFKHNEDGVLCQYINANNDFEYALPYVDVSQTENPEVEAKKYIEDLCSHGIDISEKQLFKATILKLSEEKYVFFMTLHHIISDGWSLEVLTSEVINAYQQKQQNQAITLPELSIQFKDYAVWLSDNLNSESNNEAEIYWKENFSGTLPILSLPTYQSRPKVKTYTGKIFQYDFSKQLIKKLKSISKEHQATLFMTLMASVKMLLSRYSNQTDIILGTPIAGRSHPDLEPQVGLYLNTLAIRTQFNSDDHFSTILSKEKDQLIAAYAHQDFPFDKLVESLEIPRDTSRSPLFDVMVVLQNQQQLSSFQNNGLSDITITDFEIARETSQFDLSFSFVENDSLTLLLSYNTDLYDVKFVKNLVRHLENIFKEITANQEIKLNEIDLITSEEKNQLLTVFNDTEEAFPLEKTVVDLFHEQVQKNPTGIAVKCDDAVLSYQALDEKSTALANFLREEHAISSGQLVGVYLDRSADLLISLLAILKTGAAYVPIDLNYPEERVTYIKEDAGITICIDEAFLKTYAENEVLNKQPLHTLPTSDNVAYVIYTSGSTGKPKGVVIKHKSLTNLCFWHQKAYTVTDESKGTLFSGIGFDASVWEIYPYLTVGASLVPIQDNSIRLDVIALSNFLRNNKITHTYLPSRVCQDFIANNISNLDTTILTGGEALVYSKETNLKIYNNYGPTENTVVTTFFDCTSAFNESIPIGKPVSNTKVYVLSETLQLVPIGVTGELCIAGIGLADGYLNRPNLTAEKFIENPFNTEEKLYRTGDLVKWLHDGNIEFVGRKDSQIKIRGHRVELGEIEQHIVKYSQAISQAVVVQQNLNTQDELAAYYISNTVIDEKELRTYLKSQLPSYMVPNYYKKLESIPLSANGKIAKDKLQIITKNDLVKGDFVSATNETEEKVIAIWEELLGEQTIGITDNFFELGGHSLLLSKLANTYHKVFQKELDLKAIYANPTPEYHAYLLRKNSTKTYEQITPVVTSDIYELSPSQLRFWLLYKIRGKSKEFNICNSFVLSENLNFSLFEKAFNVILERHETLRTVFFEIDGEPKQKIEAFKPVQISVQELPKEVVKRQVFYHEFELQEAPLYKLSISTDKGVNTLFFNIHHIISDGWSIEVIVEELLQVYQALLEKRNLNLEELTIHYKDYAHWQNNLLATNKLKDQRTYWNEKLSGHIPYLQLPKDYTYTNKKKYTSSRYHTIYLDEQTKEKISNVSKRLKTSVFSLFLASFKVLLYKITSEKELTVGIPAANRTHDQVKRIVGCFLNTLMLRDTLIEEETFEAYVTKVNQTLMEGLANQNYPFENILEDIQVTKEQYGFPISPVFLNMLDFNLDTLESIQDFNTQQGTIDSVPKFELECYLKTYINGMAINCVYNDKLFTPETIAYWMKSYVEIIEQVLAKPSKELQEISVFNTYVSEPAATMPANSFTTFDATEIEQTIISRFEKQAQKYPNRIAVHSENHDFTYREINNLAATLAFKIDKESGGNSKRIALLLSHNESSVIGMLGVQKTGKTYVPIDANAPMQRIQFILQDAESTALVYDYNTKKIAEALKASNPELIIIEIPTEIDAQIGVYQTKTVAASAEAYILYTSGSTGKPKGVVQAHRNVLHYIRVYTNNVRISINDNLSVLSTYTFDASVKDIYGAILNGATVSFYDVSKQGLTGFYDWLHSREITILHMVPTIYRHFLKELESNQVINSVRLVDLGGEASYKSDFDLFKKYFTKKAFLVNDYGPTEATIISQNFMSHDASPTRNNISLGNTVRDTEVMLLGENGEHKGVYQEGEIVFKSEYLSLGYLNRPALNEKAFITSEAFGGRIYKSGDIGRRLPNGQIEFVKRKDTQVKLNGVRIELAEIEYQLEQVETIKEAVVLVKDVDGVKYLTAYVVTNTEVSKEDIQRMLKASLPKYMIPTSYVFMESLPYTRTGKIDKKSLPELQVSATTKTYIAPESDIEIELTSIWSEVLKNDVNKIGVTDNFFELGGNSLQAIILLNKINKAYNTALSIENLYDTLTIRDLATLLEFSVFQLQENTIENHDIDHDEVIL